MGTRHQPHSARSCVLWGQHETAWGGRLLPGCGASGVGRSPTPDCPPSGRAARAHYPLAVGAGGCGRGSPSQTPQRALLEAGFARAQGGMRVPGGGACCLGVGGPGSGALPPPTARPLGGLLGPTTHWLWVQRDAGVGTRHETPQRALLRAGFARCGGGTRAPEGGASCLGVGRPGSGALPAPTAPPLGGLPGPTAHWLWVCGGAGMGTHHQPHSARSCVLCGRHEGARGRRLLPGCGASGVWRSPTPDCPASGRAAGAHYPLAVGAGGCGRGDPSPTPQRALLRAGFARCGGGMRVPGGLPLAGCGASGVGRSPSPDCPPSGRAAGAHYPPAVGAGGCGRGDPSPTPQRALLRAGFARRRGGTRARGGGASCLGVGRLGLGALSLLTARLLRGLPGPTTQWLWVRGGAGVGTRHQPHSARSCVLWVRHEGARGGASCLGVGRPGSGALPPPTACPLGGLPKPTTHWLWVRGGAGVGTRHQPHSARSCELALRAVGAA